MVGMGELKDLTKALPKILEMTSATTEGLAALGTQLDTLIALQREQNKLLRELARTPLRVKEVGV